MKFSDLRLLLLVIALTGTFSFVFLPVHISSWFIGIAALLALLPPYPERIPAGKKFTFVIFTGFVFYLLLRVAVDAIQGYSTEPALKLLPVILLPLIFLLRGEELSTICTSKYLHSVFTVLVLSAASIWNGMILLNGYTQVYEPFHDFAYRYRTEFAVVSGVQPAYAAMFLGIVILIHLNEITKTRLRSQVILRIILSVLALVFLLLLSSRMALIALVPSGVCFLPYLRKISFKKSGVIFLVLCAVFCLALPFYLPRIQELSTANLNFPQGHNHNSVNVRIAIWYCAAQQASDHLFIGTGPSILQEHLNECYESYHTTAFSKEVYNSHNQYLEYLAGAGIPMLLLFLASLFLPFFMKFDTFSKALSLYFVVNCLTENVLGRQWGVMIFALFFSIQYFLNLKPDEDSHHRLRNEHV